ncbi:uncharacterized protein LOC131650640 [Vicia villosa]|uniref:uncharacterized protein LOC131650640 n=1 Tax=Vicia villosa TaxID=3911 RepID=UPI00273BBA6B|nr:uncharacterized protein LOC131650640 [Vicia villosa]
MKELRPISLCNVAYKLVSKLLANRMKCCLAKCVFKEQSAFVKNRSILDNAMMAIEIIHALKRKTSGNKSYMALKIDISKAYDRVDWGFLRGMLRRLGANIAEVAHLMELLKTYATASGQEINLAKSEVFFSRNLSVPAQEDIAKIMGVRHVLGTGSYLGLPSMIGRSKKETFAFIKDRIWKRINSWSGRALSKAGKEVMIKSVLQSIPAYIMSVYIIPDEVVDDIEKMLNSFWWGGGNNNKGIQWLAWEKLSYSKRDGGLGFKDFRAFNLAMVAKQGWNFLTKPHSLVSKIFKARYFPNSSFLDANVGSNPSFLWRSLWKAKDVLRLGCRWSIGDGSQIRVVNEPWIRGCKNACLGGPYTQGVYNLYVQDLLLPNTKQWNILVVESLFDNVVAKEILSVPLVEDVVVNGLVWSAENSENYSVRSGYRLWRNSIASRSNCKVVGNWEDLWNIMAPPRVKLGVFAVRREDRRDAGRFAMMVEVIWKNRNNIVWNNEREGMARLGLQAYVNWQDWFTTQIAQERSNSNHLPVVWSPPADNWVKCNVDADFNKSYRSTNRGWFFRDNLGRFITAGIAWDIGSMSTIEAEALALKEVVQHAISLNLNFVIFESDSQVVIQDIHSNVSGLSEFNLILLSIKCLLALIPNFEVKFIKRQANMVADTLVKAVNSWSRRSFVNVIPPCIDFPLINDMS